MKYLLYILAVAILLLGGACSRHSESRNTLDHADAVMEERPDSALALLQGIDCSTLNGDEEKARYALLMSMALDKNYIDTTTFDVLQPAIDYYLQKGSPDEKLKTYYYQGRIYQNMGNEDDAMDKFLKALDFRASVTDTLSLARVLGAQAVIFFKEYKLNEYINNSLDAATLYHKLGKTIPELRSYINALDGCIMMSDRAEADSIMDICASLSYDDNYCLFSSKLSYLLEFGTLEELQSLIAQCDISYVSDEDALNIAYGYVRTGELDKAMSAISDIEVPGSVLDSLKFLSIKIDILEKQGEYRQAYDLYNKYSVMLEGYQKDLFSKDLLFAEKKHKIEIDNMIRVQNRDKMIWAISLGCLIMLLICALLYYRNGLLQEKHAVVEKEKEKAELERDKKILEAENLDKEKEKAELERNKKILEAENLDKENKRLAAERSRKEMESELLRMEIDRLEIERDNLKEFLGRKAVVDPQLMRVVKLRLDMLNGLLAKEITNNEKHAIPYKKWLESVRVKKDEFMNSTRMVLTALYPKFIGYLESHGLTVDEINYLSLYAIGLIGKEIGEYTQIKRHYAMSSEIRRKLGMDSHDTNIAVFVRNKMKEIEGE